MYNIDNNKSSGGISNRSMMVISYLQTMAIRPSKLLTDTLQDLQELHALQAPLRRRHKDRRQARQARQARPARGPPAWHTEAPPQHAFLHVPADSTVTAQRAWKRFSIRFSCCSLVGRRLYRLPYTMCSWLIPCGHVSVHNSAAVDQDDLEVIIERFLVRVFHPPLAQGRRSE